MSVLLTDERGHVVDRRVSEPSLRAQLDRINIAPGSGDRGDHAGTNAIRTALARHLASVVDRGEDLVEPLTGMAFASAPVTDPHQTASPGASTHDYVITGRDIAGLSRIVVAWQLANCFRWHGPATTRIWP
jgi:hypothetical protein